VAPLWDTNGIQFDTNALVSLPNDSVVNDQVTTFSAEMWVKPQYSNGYYEMWLNFGENDHYFVNNQNTSLFCPQFNTAYPSDSSWSGEFYDWIWASDPNGVCFTYGQWYHIVLTREPSTGNLATYINGAPGDSTENSGFPHPQDPPNMWFTDDYWGHSRQLAAISMAAMASTPLLGRCASITT
jgi:Concanavalin A-like lectin/glucanases superfamily